MPEVKMYCDGSCKGNGQANSNGGWGVVLQYENQNGIYEKEIFGGESDTTNNRMELQAAISGLSALTRPVSVTITTDSKYIKDGITKWIHKWKENGWRTSNNKPVKNRDLWERLDELIHIHDVTWQWVKGHEGHPENERADKLAQRGIHG